MVGTGISSINSSISSQAVHWDKGNHLVVKDDDVTSKLRGFVLFSFILVSWAMYDMMLGGNFYDNC